MSLELPNDTTLGRHRDPEQTQNSFVFSYCIFTEVLLFSAAFHLVKILSRFYTFFFFFFYLTNVTFLLLQCTHTTCKLSTLPLIHISWMATSIPSCFRWIAEVMSDIHWFVHMFICAEKQFEAQRLRAHENTASASAGDLKGAKQTATLSLVSSLSTDSATPTKKNLGRTSVTFVRLTVSYGVLPPVGSPYGL